MPSMPDERCTSARSPPEAAAINSAVLAGGSNRPVSRCTARAIALGAGTGASGGSLSSR